MERGRHEAFVVLLRGLLVEESGHTQESCYAACYSRSWVTLSMPGDDAFKYHLDDSRNRCMRTSI